MAKKKLTKARQSAVNEYRKQRRRVQQTVSRAQKRGYRFPENLIPESIKKLGQISTQKLKSLAKQLKELTSPKIYKEATAVSDISGEIISGTEKRREERQEAAQKGQRTKYFQELGRREEERKWQEYEDREDEDLSYSEWMEERRQKDEENLKRLAQDEEYRKQFEAGEVVYNQVLTMIEQASQESKQASWSLMMELQEEINTFGKDKVMRSISQAPQDYIEAAQIALQYNPGSKQHIAAIHALATIIRGGEVMTAEESAKLTERAEADATFDPLPDE